MTQKNFGVPAARRGLVQPLVAHRFRIKDCKSEITEQVMNVEFDFIEDTVTVQLRANVEGQAFDYAKNFSKTRFFTVIFPDGGADKPLFGLNVSVEKAIEHKIRFDYAMDRFAIHHIVFKAQTSVIEFLTDEEADLLPSDPSFPTPTEAMEILKKQTNGATKTK